MRATAKDEVINVIANTASRFPTVTSTAIASELLPLLRDHDHLAGPIAKLVVLAGIDNAASTLASDFLSEIANFQGQGTLGSFVVELGNQSPS